MQTPLTLLADLNVLSNKQLFELVFLIDLLTNSIKPLRCFPATHKFQKKKIYFLFSYCFVLPLIILISSIFVEGFAGNLK